ncbi:hypothetical protein LX12_001264 [Williamsia serinedens]|uniref:Uncharacterized protein n=1 Tax=Williamsia serinedens TaxID=391736 RepID=A0ABT1GYL9_9NOCA|nr:hypothetical protein [Williamsia serinedens]
MIPPGVHLIPPGVHLIPRRPHDCTLAGIYRTLVGIYRTLVGIYCTLGGGSDSGHGVAGGDRRGHEEVPGVAIEPRRDHAVAVTL